MAILQALCNSFKEEVLEGTHVLLTDTLKIALYSSAATLGKGTTAYSTSNEVSGTGYTAGGNTLSGVTVVLDGDIAIVDFTDPTWTTSTITARGALIYNSSKANRAIAVINFGQDISSTGGTFTIALPAATAAKAIIGLG